MGLPVPARCVDLCQKGVAWLRQRDHVMPEKSQLGCRKADTGEHICDVPLKPPDVAVDKDSEDPYGEDAGSHGGDALDQDHHTISPPEDGEEDEDEDEDGEM